MINENNNYNKPSTSGIPYLLLSFLSSSSLILVTQHEHTITSTRVNLLIRIMFIELRCSTVYCAKTCDRSRNVISPYIYTTTQMWVACGIRQRILINRCYYIRLCRTPIASVGGSLNFPLSEPLKINCLKGNYY